MPQQRLFVSDSFAVLQDAFVAAVQALKTADPLAPLTVLAPGNLLALRLRRGFFMQEALQFDEWHTQ